MRAGEGVEIRSEHAPYAAVLLSACPPGARRDLHVMTAEPGAARDAHAHLRGTTEHVVATTGRWRRRPVDGEVELAPGDDARFPADRPHAHVALEPGSAADLIMEYR